MLNYIWAFMILLGVIYAAYTGNMSAVTNAALDSAGEAISLCITMAGVVALWMGLMEIAKEAGLIFKMTNAINPFLKFMFPRIPEGHPAKEYIATNIIANVLGLGWACTPAGLKAMEELAKLEEERGNPEYASKGGTVRRASNEMCNFLILNISSLQLIPVNMIAYRSQYGSANPAVIIAPAILATFISTVAAIVFCKVKNSAASSHLARCSRK
ncbi:MAG: nucleoside recognition protein [Lachnoclostridium sp.]|nr:nucleoside recognition protein [Lachnospira sp.]MCM1246971.1 nucleoside recognition protein [Lachnoclostridium sp.]MCM1535022.1 nucleoside recognition protein [Clostridium sp.]